MTNHDAPLRWLSLALVAPLAAGGFALTTLWASANNPRQEVIDAATRAEITDTLSRASSSVELSTLAVESSIHDRAISSLSKRLDRVNARLAALRSAPVPASTRSVPTRVSVTAPPATDATTGAS